MIPKNCQIFTPKETVRYMLDLIEYKNDIFGKKIIDNACGNGNFLLEITERFISDALETNKSLKRIKKGLEDCIVGIEVDRHLVEESRKGLDSIAEKYGIHGVKWSVYCGDGLTIDENQKFDYVVGNPPYIAYKDLDEPQRCNTRKKFKSCEIGKFDYSYAFIEKGLNLLNQNGKMVMIAPSNMFKTVFGEELREIIKPFVTKIIDVSSMRIFSGVLTSPAISVYHKLNQCDTLEYIELKNQNDANSRSIRKESLTGKWIFGEKAVSGHKRFGDYFKVSNSIATLANKVFIHEDIDSEWQTLQVERAVLKPAVSPKSILRSRKQVIIFPYYYSNGKLMRYKVEEMERRFPHAMSYLKKHRNLLEIRDSDKNSEWYEYGRSQALQHLDCEKLLLSTIITNKVKIFKLQRDEIPYTGLYIIPRQEMTLEEAMRILQSEEFYKYLLKIGVKVSGHSIRITARDIEEYRF